MLRRFLALVACVGFSLAPVAAYADEHCFGCNIIDAGKISQLKPGDEVYVDNLTGPNPRLRVVEVDGDAVYIERDNGARTWFDGDQLYGPQEIHERDSATIGISAGIAVMLAAILAGKDSESSSAQSSEPDGAAQPN